MSDDYDRLQAAAHRACDEIDRLRVEYALEKAEAARLTRQVTELTAERDAAMRDAGRLVEGAHRNMDEARARLTIAEGLLRRWLYAPPLGPNDDHVWDETRAFLAPPSTSPPTEPPLVTYAICHCGWKTSMEAKVLTAFQTLKAHTAEAHGGVFPSIELAPGTSPPACECPPDDGCNWTPKP